MPTPFEQRQRRRSVILSLGGIAGGIVVGLDALQALRRGVPVRMLHGPSLDGFTVLAISIVCVLVCVAVLIMKPNYISERSSRGSPPAR